MKKNTRRIIIFLLLVPLAVFSSWYSSIFSIFTGKKDQQVCKECMHKAIVDALPESAIDMIPKKTIGKTSSHKVDELFNSASIAFANPTLNDENYTKASEIYKQLISLDSSKGMAGYRKFIAIAKSMKSNLQSSKSCNSTYIQVLKWAENIAKTPEVEKMLKESNHSGE